MACGSRRSPGKGTGCWRQTPRTPHGCWGDALALWQGPPFADLTGEPSLQSEVDRLEELRVSAMEDRIAAELTDGHHAQLVGELEGLTAAHPLRERLWVRLMRGKIVKR
jgi:DNA-binding SARP family transcriptional activator